MAEDWEEYYRANREHIDKLFGPTAERSRRAKLMGNRELSSRLYKMLLEEKLDEVLVAEAAERIGAAKQLTTVNLGEN